MKLFNVEEIKRLHALGFALHWLKPKSKAPVDSGWTKGPRLSLPELLKKYTEGNNLGVRLGSVSKIGKYTLAVIDLDIKSTSPKHRKEAEAKLYELFPQARSAPTVQSGRGNGSAHVYILLPEAVRGEERKAQSKESVKVYMPSSGKPSAHEVATLEEWDIVEGWRLRPAWEISVLSEGRQVVLPGSLHPDTGKAYAWKIPLQDAAAMPVLTALPGKSAVSKNEGAPSPSLEPKAPYKFTTVLPESLGLRPDQVAAIKEGTGVTDRSAACFSVTMAMLKRGVSEQKILSVLTDKNFYLGETGFDHAKTTSRQRAALWVDKYCLRKAKEKVNESSFDFAPEEVSPDGEGKKNSKEGLGVPVVMVGTKGLELTEEWQKELDLQRSGGGAPPTLRGTVKNIRLIMENVVGEDLIRKNEFVGEDVWSIETPWGFEAGKKRSAGTDDAIEINGWLISEWGVEASLNSIDQAITAVALNNRFHPVKDFLDTLPHWDGVHRLDTAFKKYLGADMPEPYLSEVSRKFFLAMMARIYEPGCKFDHIVVFEGRQGIGKSTFGPLLIQREWFIDSLGDLSDKDAALNLQGMWLVEMGELSSIYRSKMEETKSFITRQTDKIRPPYGHRRIEMPRSCVFYGTTNHGEYLIDSSGNRRYWPVWVEQLKFKALKRDRLQLLAEAKFLYENFMEPLYLEGKSVKQAEAIQATRRVDDESDSMLGKLLQWLQQDGTKVNNLIVVELFGGSGPFINYQQNHSNMLRAARALKEAGYEKRHTELGNRWCRKDDF